MSHYLLLWTSGCGFAWGVVYLLGIEERISRVITAPIAPKQWPLLYSPTGYVLWWAPFGYPTDFDVGWASFATDTDVWWGPFYSPPGLVVSFDYPTDADVWVSCDNPPMPRFDEGPFTIPGALLFPLTIPPMLLCDEGSFTILYTPYSVWLFGRPSVVCGIHPNYPAQGRMETLLVTYCLIPGLCAAVTPEGVESESPHFRRFEGP